MTILQELYSFLPPPQVQTAASPEVGKQAPSVDRLALPRPDGKPTVLTFLRHCGCPFAEKTFLALREAARKDPDIHFTAVSHSTQQHTDGWLQGVGGGPAPSNLEVVVDDRREIYAAWGLGAASFWHVLSPYGLYDAFRLAREEGIANRPTESGFRFQTGGSWAVDGRGEVVWGSPAKGASEIPDFGEAVRTVKKN